MHQVTGAATRQVRAIHAGRIGQQLLEQDQPLQVLGVTSRGFYLQLAQAWVVFLTNEASRGPLTVNLDRHLLGPQPGEPAVVRGGSLYGAEGWVVSALQIARTWQTPDPPTVRRLPGEQLDSLLRVARYVLVNGSQGGWAGLLAPLLSLSLSTGLEARLIDLVAGLQTALADREWQPALHLAIQLLGLGRGLTPSGDDLLLGLLLGMRRMNTGAEDLQISRSSFEQGLVAAARRQTTSLSASLLACAAQGQADERLVTALDGLLSGVPGPQRCADLLLSWGSSSGCDALVGMALAILGREKEAG